MCDAMSLGSAFASIAGGFAGRIDARSRGNFEAAQLESMGILASATASEQGTAITRVFAETARRNAAAMAVSGLAQASFSNIAEGNRKDLSRNLRQIEQNKRSKQDALAMRANIARLRVELEGASALFNGFLAAANTLTTAERIYQDTNTGQSRAEFLKESLGGSFFRKG